MNPKGSLSKLGQGFLIRYKFWFSLLGVLFLSLVVFRVIFYIHFTDFERFSNAEYEVIQGTAASEPLTNRLLGPFLVLLISRLGFPFVVSLVVFNLLMVISLHQVMFLILFRLTDRSYEKSFRYLILFAFLLIAFQDYWWLFTWDYIDVLVFSIFIYGVSQGVSLPFFGVLFLVGILNRESGLFIALWLVIDAFNFRPDRQSKFNFKLEFVDKRKLLLGILLLLGGIVYIQLVRDYRFTETAANIGDGLAPKTLGNHIVLGENIWNLLAANLISINIINTFFILGLPIYFYSNRSKFNELISKCVLLFACILGAIFTFGVINETRIFFILIPFLLFFHMTFSNRRAEPENQSA